MAKNKVIMAIVVMTGGLVVVGNGCSRFLSSDNGSDSDDYAYRGETVSDPNATDGNIHVILGAPTTSTIYSKAALQSKEFQLGIKASTRTEATYITSRGTIASKGDVTTFTPPMGMAITTIVADVCDDLINNQANLPPEQQFFRYFDLSAAGRPSLAAMDYSIRAFSLAVWDRQPDNTELQILNDLIADAIPVNEVSGQRKSALMLCTTMNSTTESIVR